MAFLDSHRILLRPSRSGEMLRRLWETPFDRRAREISRRVAELRALSEEDLAARGLQRSDILRYALTGKTS
ncbi:hypothetical protein [Roseivivax sp. CAU 1761]